MQTIETRVDSEAARYYLEHYLPGNRMDTALDERIDRVYQSANGGLPDRGELKRLSDEFSVDFAALYLVDQIAHMPVNRRFRIAFDHAYDSTRIALPRNRVKLSRRGGIMKSWSCPFISISGLLDRVPIWLLRGRRLRRLGLTCHFVETQDDGAVEANADMVAAAIRAPCRAADRLIVLSASKSGPEVGLR